MKWAICIPIVAAIFIALVMGGFHWLIVHTLLWSVGAKEDALTSPNNFKPIGDDLALLCQTYQAHSDWFENQDPFAPPWTPAPALALHPTWVQLSADAAHIEYGGGFYHFGYDLSRDDAAAVKPGEKAWVLSLARENQPDRVLERFAIPSRNRLTEQQFVDRMLAELNRRIAANSDAGSIGPPEWYASAQRVNFAVQHHVVDRILRAIHDSAKQNRHDWRDTLYAYLIDHQSDPAGADAALDKWAASDGDFSAWLLAAYGFDEAGDRDAAAAAVMMACKSPADDPTWLPTIARYRGLAMCDRLYREQEYAAAEKLCDTLLASSASQNYLSAEIQRIRHFCAASAASARLPPIANEVRFDPFAGVQLAPLLKEATARTSSRSSR